MRCIFCLFQTQKQENRYITKAMLLWAHRDLAIMDTVQRRTLFLTIGSDLGRHFTILGKVQTQRLPIVPCDRPKRVRMRFSPIVHSLNARGVRDLKATPRVGFFISLVFVGLTN